MERALLNLWTHAKKTCVIIKINEAMIYTRAVGKAKVIVLIIFSRKVVNLDH
jgi:hypothetical protein